MTITPQPSKRLLPTGIEMLVVGVILGVLLVLVVPAVLAVRNPKGPSGEMIPSAPPDEARRVVHPTGLSIVAPVNWDQIRDRGPLTPFLCVACRGAPGVRLKSYISVEQCEHAPDNDFFQRMGFAKVQFQQQPAYELAEIRKKAVMFDDPGMSVYLLYAERNKRWWMITLLTADERTVVPKQLQQYIDTIQFPK